MRTYRNLYAVTEVTFLCPPRPEKFLSPPENKVFSRSPKLQMIQPSKQSYLPPESIHIPPFRLGMESAAVKLQKNGTMLRKSKLVGKTMITGIIWLPRLLDNIDLNGAEYISSLNFIISKKVLLEKKCKTI